LGCKLGPTVGQCPTGVTGQAKPARLDQACLAASGGVRAPAVWPGRSTVNSTGSDCLRCSRIDIEGKKQIRGKSSATSLKNHGKKVRCTASYYSLVKVRFFPGLGSCDACFDMYRSLFLPIRLIKSRFKYNEWNLCLRGKGSLDTALNLCLCGKGSVDVG
jgi:hypothetical protein